MSDMNKTIKLSCYGIVVETDGEGNGTIISDLECSPLDSSYHEEEQASRYNDMMEALESIILAHACAGVNITTPAYIEGIETAVNACAKDTE